MPATGCLALALALAASTPSLEEARRLVRTGRCAEAEAVAGRLLAEAEKRQGHDSAAVAEVLDVIVDAQWYGREYTKTASRVTAERAVAVKEKAFGPDHPEVALSLTRLARLLGAAALSERDATETYGRIQELHERALAIREKALGPDDPLVLASLEGLRYSLDFTGDARLDPKALEARLDPLWGKVRKQELERWDAVWTSAETIEVSRLNPKLGDRVKAGFPVYPYSTFAEVYEAKLLPRGEVGRFVELWKKMLEDPGSSAQCHYPGYGLRFYRGDDLLFETSVCFQCHNFYVPIAGSHRWLAMTANGEVLDAFEKTLRTLLPDRKVRSRK